MIMTYCESQHTGTHRQELSQTVVGTVFVHNLSAFSRKAPLSYINSSVMPTAHQLAALLPTAVQCFSGMT